MAILALGALFGTPLQILSFLMVTIGIGALIYLWFSYVDLPSIQGIPEIPGGELLAGHFYKLGDDHATTAEGWAQKYNWPLFQLRMGQRRAVILNSFDAAREWTVKNQAATLDRPWFYTFHGIVSKTSGRWWHAIEKSSAILTDLVTAATIGTSPWDESTKKQRRVVGSFTTGPSIRDMRPMLDLEICAMISAMHYDSDKGQKEVVPHIYQKRLALNLMTMFCYGTRFTTVKDPMLLQILSDANTIAR
jgi:phenylacetate 2-hydroxylase